MLKQLFKKNRNTFQVICAAIAAFLGLFLLLISLQVYFDFKAILRGDSDKDNFITINKPVSLVNTFLGKSVFSAKEIQDFEQQSQLLGTEAAAAFTANRFKVSASSRMLNFYTDLFFEALPTEFIDTDDHAFGWREGQEEIPIIMSKDYLALYNFGFAMSQGLPQFTPSTIRQVSFDITLQGNGQQQILRGRIVGFSERINSVLVPLTFMQWANQRFGNQADEGVSRLILKVKNPYDKNLETYLKEKGYELSTGRLVNGRLATILSTVISIVSIIGIALLLLALIVFVLNYQLLISKSSSDIKLLLQIGYHPKQIAGILRGTLWVLLGSVFFVVILALIAARWGIWHWLFNQGFEVSFMYNIWVIIIGFLLMAAIFFINNINIKKHIYKQYF